MISLDISDTLSCRWNDGRRDRVRDRGRCPSTEVEAHSSETCSEVPSICSLMRSLGLQAGKLAMAEAAKYLEIT